MRNFTQHAKLFAAPDSVTLLQTDLCIHVMNFRKKLWMPIWLRVCTIQSLNPHSNEPIPDLLQSSVRCLKARPRPPEADETLCDWFPRGKCIAYRATLRYVRLLQFTLDSRKSFTDSRMFLITHGFINWLKDSILTTQRQSGSPLSCWRHP